MIIDRPIAEWKSEDYLEAREIITQARKNLGIYAPRRMTTLEAGMVLSELYKTGENHVAEYIANIYRYDFKEAAKNG